jgi:hypothetical protein
MRIIAALVLAVLPGCLVDSEGSREHVDYITFKTAGVYREQLVNIVFSSGEVAFDVLDENARYVWMMGAGPRSLYLPGIDHDQAPYPNPMYPRKHHPITLRFDKRWWQQFAGGAWRSVGIEVDSDSKMRASASYSPETVFLWCPFDRTCMTWQAAVFDEQAKCWAWNERGTAKRVDRFSCLGWHPRSHIRVDPCDDCPLPAAQRSAFQ